MPSPKSGGVPIIYRRLPATILRRLPALPQQACLWWGWPLPSCGGAKSGLDPLPIYGFSDVGGCHVWHASNFLLEDRPTCLLTLTASCQHCNPPPQLHHRHCVGTCRSATSWIEHQLHCIHMDLSLPYGQIGNYHVEVQASQ